jgi:hypothetical protein
MTIASADRSAGASRMRRVIPLAKSVARSAGISLERYPPINTPPAPPPVPDEAARHQLCSTGSWRCRSRCR